MRTENHIEEETRISDIKAIRNKKYKSVPDKILRSDTRSFDCSTDQATSSYINPPTKISREHSIHEVPRKKKKRYTISESIPSST